VLIAYVHLRINRDPLISPIVPAQSNRAVAAVLDILCYSAWRPRMTPRIQMRY